MRSLTRKSSLEHFLIFNLFGGAVIKQILFGPIELLENGFVSGGNLVSHLQIIKSQLEIIQREVGNASAIKRFGVVEIDFNCGVARESHIVELFKFQFGGGEVREVYELERVERSLLVLVDGVLLKEVVITRNFLVLSCALHEVTSAVKMVAGFFD